MNIDTGNGTTHSFASSRDTPAEDAKTQAARDALSRAFMPALIALANTKPESLPEPLRTARAEMLAKLPKGFR